MRFSTFVKHSEVIQNRLEAVNKQVVAIQSARSTQPLNDQQINKLKLLATTASQKNVEFEKQVNKLYLEVLDDSEIDDSVVTTFQDAISDLYINIQSVCSALVPPTQTEDLNVSNSTVTQPPVHTVKLPQIKLPTFSGQPDQWVTFQGLFESAVHQNEQISNIEKFSYLLSCLEGEPLSLIKSLPMNAANYLIAWQTLVKRYLNSRLLITLHSNNLLDLPPIVKPNAQQLRQFLSLYHENYQALKTLGHDIANESLILTSHILRKLDPSFRSEFEHKREDSKKVPSIQEVIEFLENECCRQEASNFVNISNTSLVGSVTNPHKNSSTVQTKTNKFKHKFVMIASSNRTQNCLYCGSNVHNIYKCNEFTTLSPQNRYGYIKGKDLCQNCFGSHKLDSCKSLHSCRECMKRHHTLLHFNKPPQKTSKTTTVGQPLQKPASQPPLESHSASSTFVGVSANQTSLVLLATALVNISTASGHNLVIRAVLDSASQTTILSEHCANLLQLPRSHDGVSEITGISSSQIRPRGLVFVNISSLDGTLLANSHPVLILDKISSPLPRVPLCANVKAKLKGFSLADPSFDSPGPIDMLIGAELFAQTLLGPAQQIGERMPYALKTIFGYVILGTSPVAAPSRFIGITSFLSTNDLDLHTTLQRFWSIEEPPNCLTVSPQEEVCEKHFLNTHSRDASGRYICRLPFKENPSNLGDSTAIAKRTFHSLERRFNSQPEFKQKYINFMKDYQLSGHMKICESIPSTNQPHCYLPHHGVFKDDKIRVVFNASAPTSTGNTLNSIQHQGPKLHNEITDIILRFRQRKIVFSCDIKNMFRMINIHEDDQCFLLIYWREDPSLPIQVYCLTTVTYGLRSSPFIANRVIRQLIQDEGKNYPLAAKELEDQIYVDDALLGSDTVEEAIRLRDDVIGLLSKGKFELHKWASNCEDVLKDLPPERRISPVMFRSTDETFVSILGLKWNPDSDTFSYVIAKPSTTLTKRALLSTIAKIYDVTGMLAPLIFWAKALMQHVWSLGLNWDTPLPANVADRWSTFTRELPEIEKLKINRHLAVVNAVSIQLHGFSDASELGFAACVYLRTEDASGIITVNLLIAKSRVAPLKRTTIPRLELCGAHILAKLLQYCVEQLSSHYKIDSVNAWCDSTIALSWIHTPSYRLKLFIANRVAQIQELTPSCMWRHISSNENPADCASRGLTASNLVNNDIWWCGPKWLFSTPTSWSHKMFTPLSENDLPELKDTALNLMTTTENNDLNFLHKFSSWTTLLHVMGYVLRFISCLRNKRKITHALSLEELQESNNKICYLVQGNSLSQEIELLKRNKTCTSRVQRLAPFLDDSGLMRVGGRLRNSDLSYISKHQIILPKDHPVVHLIIDHCHKVNLHAGPQQVQVILQEKYWILSARSIIRSRIFRCVRCFKVKPRPTTPLMGDLPSGRVIPNRCFNVSGVDYAGPYTVKLYRLRKIQPIKVYLCLFICFASKAIHLEVVTDLTTDAFIASLTRFISRRGLVSDLYSDCGTNFIGTASTLKKCFQELMQQPDLQKFAENNSVRFHFLPARAPHQGGLWERAVKSAKYHLIRVIGEQILTYEEFITLTARVEAMLNSRPITQLSADPNDLQPLTPGHFLTGGPLISLIEPRLPEEPISRLQRWRLVQAFAQHLWNRWQKEYLLTLQERSKWVKGQDNLQVGELVVIHEDNTPPLSWKMGRIVAVSPGKDGIVRVVHLKTSSNKTLTRPVVKVSCLPID